MVSNTVMVNEEVDPTLIIKRLKAEVPRNTALLSQLSCLGEALCRASCAHAACVWTRFERMDIAYLIGQCLRFEECGVTWKRT